MYFLPAVCNGCDFVFLADLSSGGSDVYACPDCGHNARTIGGWTYDWLDSGYFHDIAKAVADAHILEHAALEIAQALRASAADSERLQAYLRQLSTTISSVAIARAAIGTDIGFARRISAMLTIILVPRAARER
jgi:hypothetical protein